MEETVKTYYEENRPDPRQMKTNINPDYYKNQTSIECIEAMQIAFGNQRVYDFCLCNAWKYVWRWKNKNGTEDLDKAKWYIAAANEIVVDEADNRETDDVLERLEEYISKSLHCI